MTLRRAISPQRRAVAAAGALLALASGSACGRFGGDLTASLTRIPADNHSSGTVTLRTSVFYPGDSLLPPAGDTGAIHVTATTMADGNAVLHFTSTAHPGRVTIASRGGRRVTLEFYAVGADLDGDGFPDAAELSSENDRVAFRRWFVRIAESLFVRDTPAWKGDERDCAGLVRFCYREALKRHDMTWQRQSGIMLDKNLPDVESFNYPTVPVLGANIFRITREGAAPAAFGPFADAGTLLSLNTAPVAGSLDEAREGDLLFFHNPGSPRWPYHTMIVAERSGVEMVLIYHTGAGGLVKRVPLSYLRDDERFYPAPWNKNFLGVYRFRILE